MNSLLIAIAAVTGASEVPTEFYEWYESPITYEEILDQAINNCPNRASGEVDINLLDQLISVEAGYGVPAVMKGMLLAAACYESGYNPKAKGDHKFSKDKKTPMALGILQQWKVYEKAYGTDRLDPRSAAHGWMKHIVKQIPKVKRKCGFRSQGKIWQAAWVTGVRKLKPEGRCYERVRHIRLLRRWHRNIKKERKRMMNDGDGC